MDENDLDNIIVVKIEKIEEPGLNARELCFEIAQSLYRHAEVNTIVDSRNNRKGQIRKYQHSSKEIRK